jgi:hypothetical protein
VSARVPSTEDVRGIAVQGMAGPLIAAGGAGVGAAHRVLDVLEHERLGDDPPHARINSPQIAGEPTPAVTRRSLWPTPGRTWPAPLAPSPTYGRDGAADGRS